MAELKMQPIICPGCQLPVEATIVRTTSSEDWSNDQPTFSVELTVDLAEHPCWGPIPGGKTRG